MRLLVLGGAGLLGHTLLTVAKAEPGMTAIGGVRRLEQVDRLCGLGLQAVVCDVTSEASLCEVVSQGFDVVINCGGLTKARVADPVAAIQVNSLAPHVLAAVCATQGIRLLHISTDCVFSGRAGRYSETSLPDPIDLYGRSKLLGEVDYGDHLTVRTSFIGYELDTAHGLLEWFLRQTGTTDGYAEAYWSGLTASALSRVLLELARRPDITGVLHVGGQRIDKYSLLMLLKDAFRKNDVEIVRRPAPAIDRSLDAQRFDSLGIGIPSLPAMIAECAAALPMARR